MNKLVPLPIEKRTVFTSAGVGVLSNLTSEMAASTGKPEGPIKLLNGVEGAKGGYGNAHIEARRLKQINGLGFKDVISYVFHVLSGFDRIASQEDGRLIFLRHEGSFHHHVIAQWDDQLQIWSVTTALPKSAVRDLNIVWSK